MVEGALLRQGRCLVVEDSPAGVQAALNAGMQVVAVSTPLTRLMLREGDFPPAVPVVDEPETLPAVVAQIMEQQT